MYFLSSSSLHFNTLLYCFHFLGFDHVIFKNNYLTNSNLCRTKLILEESTSFRKFFIFKIQMLIKNKRISYVRDPSVVSYFLIELVGMCFFGRPFIFFSKVISRTWFTIQSGGNYNFIAKNIHFASEEKKRRRCRTTWNRNAS